MSKILSNILFIALFLVPSSLFGIKIQTSDEVEFNIELPVAKQSETLKNMIEDIGEEAEQSIPLPEISQKQFDLLLPVMQKLYELSMAELKPSEEELAHQLQQIVTDLKSNEQPLNNQQLIELVTGINYLDLPILEPALKALAQRMLNKDEWTLLESLRDKLRDLWQVHPVKKIMPEIFALQHPGVNDVKESKDEGNLSFGSLHEGTTEPITLEYPKASGVVESLDGKKLISWSPEKGTINIWDKNNPSEHITLNHSRVRRVIESLNGKKLIALLHGEDTIQIWDQTNLAAKPIIRQYPTPEQILLSLAVYFESVGNQKFELSNEKISELKATFNTLPTQAFLAKQASSLIAAITSAQK